MWRGDASLGGGGLRPPRAEAAPAPSQSERSLRPTLTHRNALKNQHIVRNHPWCTLLVVSMAMELPNGNGRRKMVKTFACARK